MASLCLGVIHPVTRLVQANSEVENVSNKAQVNPSWQNGLSNGAQVGEILGLYGAGIVVDKIGYRKTMLLALFSMICFIFIPFFAQNLQTLLVGEILQGVPWGVFQTMTTAYASEVAPVALRAYLTTYVNLCWVFGQFIAAGVLRSFLNRGGMCCLGLPAFWF
jgi:SP family general alpha glucoside:H+ symporter-like MFS transporter